VDVCNSVHCTRAKHIVLAIGWQCRVWQDRTDGALETQLYLKQTKRESFRSYTLVAENSVAARTQQVALIQSKLSNDCSYECMAAVLLSVYISRCVKINSKQTKYLYRHLIEICDNQSYVIIWVQTSAFLHVRYLRNKEWRKNALTSALLFRHFYLLLEVIHAANNWISVPAISRTIHRIINMLFLQRSTSDVLIIKPMRKRYVEKYEKFISACLSILTRTPCYRTKTARCRSLRFDIRQHSLQV